MDNSDCIPVSVDNCLKSLHIISIVLKMCKAVIQEGARKGKSCDFPSGPDNYCGRHGRNKIYDEGITSGKKWCRFFFRGCNNELISTDIENNITSCASCRNSKNKKTIACGHTGCKFKILSGTFCKKHIRDMYYLEEKEKEIKYCDIARGCLNILGDKKSCDNCLEKNRIVDSKRYSKKKEITKASQLNNSLIRVCIQCQTNFEVFNTKYNNESLKCKSCSEKQFNQDKKRVRVRNYKVEHLKNLKNYYKSYIKDSPKRGYGDFTLDFEAFVSLVTSPCYYCKYINQEETNGIDRINNDIGYTKENCVSACWKCNRMKHFYHPLFFIEKCKIISKTLNPTKEFFKKWSSYYTRSCYVNRIAYIKEAESRNLTFNLSEDQWDWLTRSACYLCGYQSHLGIGIDRVNNDIRGYTFGNCRPCCGSCNSMKNELPLEDLVNQCKIISNIWIDTAAFHNIPVCSNPLKDAETKGHITDPVKRTHWKAAGLYYEILSDTTQHFLESYKEVYTQIEMVELSKVIKESTKEISLKILKTSINTLKKRKIRLNQ